MPYPASSYPEGVDLTIIAGNQLHQVINGEANEVVSTTSGDIPSVRKALADSMMFKVPVDWVQGEVTTDPLETRLYNGQPYWAPEATLANPITLGASPVATTDWLLAPQGYRNEYNLGKYQAGILISDSQEYVVYNGESYFAVNPPYTTTATTPDADANMFEGNYITSDFGTVVSGTEVKHRRGTNAEIAAGTPAIGELWFNTNDNTIHMGDGVTYGGVKHINVNVLAGYTNYRATSFSNAKNGIVHGSQLITSSMLDSSPVMIATDGYHGSLAQTKTYSGSGAYLATTLTAVRSAMGDPAWEPDGLIDAYMFGGTDYVLLLINRGELNVMQSGAAGDGTTDTSETVGTDDTNSLQAWLNYGMSRGITLTGVGLIFNHTGLLIDKEIRIDGYKKLDQTLDQ